ncbi:hypothetical protein QVL71_05985, partial [Bartonella henselae]|nr:hypothetical protein [Bartonella henselae]
MLTSFGQILRKLFCIDCSERLLDMADKLGVSVAFLSSVKIGKKSVPVGIFVRTLENFSQQDLAEFKKLLEKVGKKRGTLYRHVGKSYSRTFIYTSR